MSQITAIKSTLSYHRIDDLINAVPKKLTIEFIKDEVSKLARGYICLSDVYLNNRAKLNLRCDKGHEYQASWSHFRDNINDSGRRCPYCAGKATPTIEFIKSEVLKIAPGYQCLSDVCINVDSKLNFVCDKGHDYATSWHNFRGSNSRQGARCKQCHYETRKGDTHPRYRHDLTDEERAENENRDYDLRYRQWRRAVYQRDQYRCRYCGDNKGDNLNAHHIHNFADHKEIRYNVENGITLCNICHNEFHKYFGKRNTNQAQLDRWFAARYKVLEIRKMYGNTQY